MNRPEDYIFSIWNITFSQFERGQGAGVCPLCSREAPAVSGSTPMRRDLTAVIAARLRSAHLERYTTMRAFLIPAVAAATLALGHVAFAAAQSTTGTIKALDANGHKLTLSDGTVYMLPKTTSTSSLKVGEKVIINYDMKGGNHEAISVKAAK